MSINHVLMWYLKTHTILAVAALVIVAALSGCSTSSSWPELAYDEVATNPVNMVSDDTLAVQRPPSNTEFNPPNPKRTNPFVYTIDRVSTEGQAYSGQLSSIIVQGFVSADGQAAIISVEGRAKTVKIGDTFSGIEVLQINPPTVTLRSGGTEWKASMFDRTLRGPAT